MRTGRSRFAAGLSFAAGAFVVLTGLIGKAHSDTPAESICTFTSSAITYDERHTRQTLTFSWNNDTGAVVHSGLPCSASAAASGGTAFWDALEGGVTRVQCGLGVVPGNVTPGFSTASKLTSSVYILLANGGEIRGTIHAGGPHSARPILFSGAWYGAHNYLLAGYGTVSCTP
jgi:hypothetical protein